MESNRFSRILLPPSVAALLSLATSSAHAQCITAAVAGSYELRYIDPITHDWAPACTRVLSAAGAAPVIAGGSSACEGESVELCGPPGSFEYEWTGAAGVASAAACVSADVAGEYAFRVRPLPGGCWSEPAVRGPQSPGSYVARWDGRDEFGAPARGGMYFVLGRIDGERVQTRVTLVR